MSHGGSEARPLARRVFNFDKNDLAQALVHDFGVTLRGAAWRGMAWRSLAWPGLAWPGLAWPGGLAWRGARRTVKHGAARRGVATRMLYHFGCGAQGTCGGEKMLACTCSMHKCQ